MKVIVHKTVLANGVRVLTTTIPHVRSVSMGVWVNVGARDEHRRQSGMSHFIEHMIFKGTQRRSAYQIAKAFDAIGGMTNAFTSMELTCYHARVLDAHLDTMVDILSDIFLNSEFQQGEIEKERPVVLQEIGMLEDNPEEYVHLLLGGAFWGDHALGRPILGERKNVLRFDSEEIQGFFKEYYQPDRIVISAAGNVHHRQFVDLIASRFETVRRIGGDISREAPRSNKNVTLCRRDIEQVHLCIGARGLATTDSRRYALSLLNTIFGGNMSSRLFQEIREKRGLAYSVYSFLSSHIDAGMIGVYAGVAPETVEETMRLILKELHRLRTSPAAPDELADAKEFTRGNILLSLENVDSQMVRLAQNELHFGRYIPYDEAVLQVERVTAEDIHELAGSILNEHSIAVTLVGPYREERVCARLMEDFIEAGCS